MKLYHVSDGANADYKGTLAEAHALAKACNRFDVSIEEVEIDTDKANLLRILNGEGGYERQGGRRWVLTPRGGLREVREGEEV